MTVTDTTETVAPPQSSGSAIRGLLYTIPVAAIFWLAIIIAVIGAWK